MQWVEVGIFIFFVKMGRSALRWIEVGGSRCFFFLRLVEFYIFLLKLVEIA